MDILSATTLAPGSLEAECPGGLEWAWYGLGECIRTPRDKVSVTFGVLSIAMWFIYAVPQMITNCIKKMPDEAVSPYLLIFWLLGDTLNFIGAFLTDQLFLQKLLAGYTIFSDLILIGQFVYYFLRHKHKTNKYGSDYNIDKASIISSTTSKSLTTIMLGVVGVTAFYGPGFSIKAPSSGSFHAYQGKQLLQAVEGLTTPGPFDNFLPTVEEKVGYAIGWIACVMYVCSRSSQIFVNYRRKTTEGLSMYLFILAVLGNTFYGLQIFIKSIDAVFVVTSLPWIIGSFGILCFDFVILGQFFIYRKNTAIKTHIGEIMSITMDDYDETASERRKSVPML